MLEKSKRDTSLKNIYLKLQLYLLRANGWRARVMWASTGIWAHAAANDWVSHPALNPPCHKSNPAARQTESESARTTLLPHFLFLSGP